MVLWPDRNPSVSEEPQTLLFLTADRFAFRFDQSSNCLLLSASACDVALGNAMALVFCTNLIPIIKVSLYTRLKQIYIYIYILFL
jgi:hypothetical protein